MAHVIGVDGCRDGWCAVSIHDEKDGLSVSSPTTYSSFQDALATDAEVICIDVPIGLLDGPGRRVCDASARDLLGQKWPAVFDPPCRSVLSVTPHAAASAANLRLTGRGISIQAFAIMPKIAEVDPLITPALQTRVREVHPELCFWSLNRRQPILSNKKRIGGRHERWHVLRSVLPSLPEQPPRPRELPRDCAVDDYIDALVAAWTAVCIARGSGDRIPHNPTLDNRGLRMQMWFPAV